MGGRNPVRAVQRILGQSRNESNFFVVWWSKDDVVSSRFVSTFSACTVVGFAGLFPKSCYVRQCGLASPCYGRYR